MVWQLGKLLCSSSARFGRAASAHAGLVCLLRAPVVVKMPKKRRGPPRKKESKDGVRSIATGVVLVVLRHGDAGRLR